MGYAGHERKLPVGFYTEESVIKVPGVTIEQKCDGGLHVRDRGHELLQKRTAPIPRMSNIIRNSSGLPDKRMTMLLKQVENIKNQ
ncbi:MAG: hypothetical protein KL787_03075 [Taibaiella sp.]|nr:hypothetical protein [Taibaiella sp.]